VWRLIQQEKRCDEANIPDTESGACSRDSPRIAAESGHLVRIISADMTHDDQRQQEHGSIVIQDRGVIRWK
jgi:uncharacterized tellurite resistance protein B-like protein